MNECSSKLVEIVKSVGAPLTIEVVKSIAMLCRENTYNLWYELASEGANIIGATQTPLIESKKEKISVEGPCWRCEACGKTFTDIRHLVNHITFYVRQRDKAHIELYQKMKKIVNEKRKTFTEVVMESLRC
uniref:C2H2-type domain-containing protein n=1 Tax=Ignisphaera aggregans TaxID=334771 RepID=A0A7J2U1Q5_9CREN